jgi:hypothetical protein
MAELAMQPLPVRLAKVLLRMAHSETLERPADRIEVSQRELGNIVGQRAGPGSVAPLHAGLPYRGPTIPRGATCCTDVAIARRSAATDG